HLALDVAGTSLLRRVLRLLQRDVRLDRRLDLADALALRQRRRPATGGRDRLGDRAGRLPARSGGRGRGGAPGYGFPRCLARSAGQRREDRHDVAGRERRFGPDVPPVDQDYAGEVRGDAQAMREVDDRTAFGDLELGGAVAAVSGKKRG